MAISVNMLRLRLTRDAQPRWKNGQPAQTMTGVASRSCSQTLRVGGTSVLKPCPSRCIPFSSSTTGTASAAAILSRRGHVGELGIRARLRRRVLGLERHAADRAGARTDLPHLRVHRAGVDRARLGRRRSLARQVALGVGRELAPAAAAAEMVDLAAVLVAVRRARRIDHHAADRVLGHGGVTGVRRRLYRTGHDAAMYTP